MCDWEFILKTLSNVLDTQIAGDSELYKTLGEFVSNADDSKIYEGLSNSTTPQENAYGLCFGAEKIILSFNNNCSFLHINGKPHVAGFAPPKGQITLTNYKVVYNEIKGKRSFQRSLQDLIRVEVGGPGSFMTHICLIFPNNIKVLISPEPAGQAALFVALIKEELKLS